MATLRREIGHARSKRKLEMRNADQKVKLRTLDVCDSILEEEEICERYCLKEAGSELEVAAMPEGSVGEADVSLNFLLILLNPLNNFK